MECNYLGNRSRELAVSEFTSPETETELYFIVTLCYTAVCHVPARQVCVHPASEERMHKHHRNVAKQINSLSAHGFSISQASLTLTGDPVVRKKDIASSNKTAHCFFVHVYIAYKCRGVGKTF